ncbi:hypothetical protein ACLOJK_004858 [Asimina triloba]
MPCNLFKFCSGLRVLGYFMILLVAAIIAVSYYAVVLITWGPRLLRGGPISVLAFFILAAFHLLVPQECIAITWLRLLDLEAVVRGEGGEFILVEVKLVMLTWSYLMVVFHDPGSVPENWRPVLDEGSLEAGSSVALSECMVPETMRSEGAPPDLIERPHVTYCNRCQNGKPPRCHHCSLYAFLETTLDTLVLLPQFIKIFGDAKRHSSSPGNLAVYEKRRTGRWKYDLGRRKNFEQVFGSRKAYWLVPMFSKADLENIHALEGLDFPTRSDAEAP